MIARKTLLLGLVVLLAGRAAGSVLADEAADYLREIKPLLREKCFACHGALKQQGGLRLDTVAAMRTGGEIGAAVVPGDAESSLLLQRVRGEGGDQMPLEGVPLSAAQIELVERWIAAGAPEPANEAPDPDPREHWAFQPPQRPALPMSAASAYRSPIDALLAAEHQRQGLTLAPPASKEVLLRRVYLDLVGLPPTEQQLRDFLADDRPDAYERVVDALLDSPHHGERWGRHWMDVWRYSDWFGRRMVPDVWNSAPQIWRWRDWIVRSLNEDHGYDRMVREMLAADELAAADPEAIVATGYLIRNWYALNPNDWMRQNVEHTAKAFLALTYNCAHCHDHKYDPITHDDYFELRAFFEPIGIRQDRVAGEADPGPFQEYEYSVLRKIQRLGYVQVYDKQPSAPTHFYMGGDERQKVTEKGSIPPGLPAVLEPADFAVKPIQLPTEAWYPGYRADIQATIRSEHERAIAQATEDLEAARAAAEPSRAELATQLAAAEAAYETANQSAAAMGQSIALAGQQALLLDATTGRRIIFNPVAGLRSLDEGTVLRFDLMILQNTHVNFQLARDVVKGLTASYLAFDADRIVAYQPGSFSEFEVARYDFAGGQKRFAVELLFVPAQDHLLLTLRTAPDQVTLAERVPIALNGWNPSAHPHQAIAFDARPGSLVAVDAIELRAPQTAATDSGSELLVQYDFEGPAYAIGSEVVGQEGWQLSSFGQAPATSQIAAVVPTPELRELAARVTSHRRALESLDLKIKAAEATLAARQAELASLELRIQADRVRYGGGDESAVTDEVRAAAAADRQAQLLAARATRLSAAAQLAEAEGKPASDMMRAAAIDAAGKQLAAADTALAQLETPPAENSPVTYRPLTHQYPQESTGRRTALANWIGSRQNPLTARVAINHIWMRHFHEPLVPTVFDFGRNGKVPTHPELLDWLAVEFMESGWSMKHIHRLIVTSDAYRRSSSTAAATPSATIDPENKYLWRMNYARIEAEVVRDSLLSVAGRLDLQMGGQELENGESLKTFRRSLYYSCHPEGDGKGPLGMLFDAADATECYRRTRSIMPQQALALTNSDLVHEVSIAAAAQMQHELSASAGETTTDDEQFIERAFLRILSRAPDDRERQHCREFLARQAELLKMQEGAEAAPQRARESLVRVLLNHNDFVTVR